MKKLLIISLLIVGCITEPEILCPEQKIYIECGADITTYIFEGEIIDEHNTFVIVNGNDTLFNYLDYNIQVYNTLNLFYSKLSIINPNVINNCDSLEIHYSNHCNYTQVTSVPLLNRMSSWKLSSPPYNYDMSLMDLNNRLQIDWYNPYNDILANEIWPSSSSSPFLALFINIYSDLVINDSTVSWVGITQELFEMWQYQSPTYNLIVWLNTDDVQDNIMLDIQFGTFSEDINSNQKLDTEDKDVYGPGLGDMLLDENEDTGLDGCFDIYEDGYGGCQDYENNGINDPNGDNWEYSDINNYKSINNLEGNAGFLSIFNRPDTEDLNKNTFLDITNSYYSYRINLLNIDTNIIDNISYQDGNPNGWKSIKIPFIEFLEYYEHIPPNWEDVKNIRLVFNSENSLIYENNIKIAKIEIVK